MLKITLYFHSYVDTYSQVLNIQSSSFVSWAQKGWFNYLHLYAKKLYDLTFLYIHVLANKNLNARLCKMMLNSYISLLLMRISAIS